VSLARAADLSPFVDTISRLCAELALAAHTQKKLLKWPKLAASNEFSER